MWPATSTPKKWKFHTFSGLDLAFWSCNCLWMLRMQIRWERSRKSMFTAIRRFRQGFNKISQKWRGSLIFCATIPILNLNHKTELTRCETTKGCEKHYIERTIAGETIYEIERSCKRDDVCYSEYVNCHDVHVSNHQPIRLKHVNGVNLKLFFRREKIKLDKNVKAAAPEIFAMMWEETV